MGRPLVLDPARALAGFSRRVARWTNRSNVFGHVMRGDPLDRGIDLPSLHNRPLTDFANSGEVGFFIQNVKPRQTVVDVGANIGLYTLLLARLVGPSGRVFAFEPGPQSFRLLSENIAANGYTRITAERMAVAEQSGEGSLWLCDTGGSDNHLVPVGADMTGFETAPIGVVSLDQYFQGRRVDVVKIDVQGGEMAVLRGMRGLIAANPEIQIITEWNRVAASDGDLAFIRGCGLGIFVLPEHGPERPASDGDVGALELASLVLRRPL